MDDKSMKRPRLLLLDCLGIDFHHLWDIFEIEANSKQSKNFIILFNVVTDKKVEKEALERAVWGILHVNNPLKMFIKVVKAVLNGEMCYSRKTLTKFIVEQKSLAGLPEDPLPSLTSRERQILIKIASGAGNKEIAADLCISIHTVKTHITNIFKKIKVSSRFRAAQFVAKHF